MPYLDTTESRWWFVESFEDQLYGIRTSPLLRFLFHTFAWNKTRILIFDFVTVTKEATPKVFLLFPLLERDSPPSLPPRMATRLNKTWKYLLIEKKIQKSIRYNRIHCEISRLPFVRVLAIDVSFVAAHTFPLIEKRIVRTNDGETFSRIIASVENSAIVFEIRVQADRFSLARESKGQIVEKIQVAFLGKIFVSL